MKNLLMQICLHLLNEQPPQYVSSLSYFLNNNYFLVRLFLTYEFIRLTFNIFICFGPWHTEFVQNGGFYPAIFFFFN